MCASPSTRKTATIRDVAEQAGVSIGTVSRYLNGYSLKQRNTERIERAIKDLGYKENFIAKGMKTRRTMTIGVAVPNLDAFHAGVLSLLDKILSKRGYFIVLCDYEGDPTILNSKLTFLYDRYVDGLIVSPIPGDVQVLEKYKQEQIPFVFFNDIWPGFAADKVFVDNELASGRAVEYLIQMNHRKIGIVNGPMRFSTAAGRFAGFKRALRERGARFEERWAREADWGSIASGYSAGKSLLSQRDRPTALFAANYLLGVGVLHAVNELGLRIPKDLSFVSFDDSDIFQAYRPAITCIRQPLELISESVAQLMIRRLGGDTDDFPNETVLQTSLILRDSVRLIE